MRPLQFLLSILIIFPLGLAAQGTLHLASDVWPPFTDNPPRPAYALDLVREALERTGREVKVSIASFDDVLSDIERGTYDGCAALWHSEQREQYMRFSAPYLQNQLVLVGRKGSDVSALSLAELQNKRVAVVGAYEYGSGTLEAPGVEIIAGASDQENLERLINEEVDYMLADALLVAYLLSNQSAEANQFLAVGTRPLIRRPLHFALRKSLPESSEILKDFNKVIMEMVADGSYHRILNLRWIHTDVDGDGRLEMVLDGQNAGSTAPAQGYDVYFHDSIKGGKTGEGRRYYVDGRFYQTWEDIPREYKRGPMRSEKLNQMEMLNFSF